MRTYYTARNPETYHVLPAGEQSRIGRTTTSLRQLPTKGEPTIATLTDIRRSGLGLHLEWAIGGGLHKDLLAQALGKPAAQSLVQHELTLRSSRLLRIGAVASLGLDGGIPEVIAMGGHYEMQPDSSRQIATPFNREAQRLAGRIIISSAQTFMEMAEQDSCALLLAFNLDESQRSPTESGMLTRTE